MIINTDDNFYVFLNLSEGGQAYDRTSDIPVLLGGSSRTIVPSVANTGESFYAEDNLWKDFYDYDDPSGYDNSGNFCIKALTVYNTNINIKETNEIKFEIHPNPASEYIQFNTAYKKPFSYKIFDVAGKYVSSNKAGTNKLIDIRNLNTGLYFIQIKIEDKILTKRLIIK